jgi:hypothetical protein
MRLLILSFLSLAVGCNGTDLTPKFVGTWATTAGKATTTCPGGAAIADQDLAASGLTIGVTSDGSQRLVAVNSSSSACGIHFSVAGNLATADAGQSCTLGSTVIGIKSSTLTLTGDTLAVTADTNLTISGNACTGTYVGVTAARR